MQKETVSKTLGVALALCIVCSILVSVPSVMLKEKQLYNAKIDLKKNMLVAAGLLDPDKATTQNVEQAYKKVSGHIINLKDFSVESKNVDSFNQSKYAKTSEGKYSIPEEKDFADIKFRSKKIKVFVSKKNGKLDALILPIKGRGLWSTLYGFLVLDGDLNTVKGLAFYEHGETPGLGGEVDNPRWKKSWVGKNVYKDGKVALKVIKGQASPQSKYHVDGLSGATITSNGVTNTIRYWMGPNAYGPLLTKIKNNKVAL